MPQDCTPFDAVLAWRGAVPTAALVALLEQGFWPQWHAILAHWLVGAPDHNEVARWYLSWKSRFPQARPLGAMRDDKSTVMRLSESVRRSALWASPCVRLGGTA